MKVIAFNGSPRENGNTAHLLRRVCAVLNNRQIETEIMQIGGLLIHGCRACMGCLQNGHCVIDTDTVNTAIDKMLAADGIIIGSPVYFADVTPEIKALIDRAGFATGALGTPLKYKVGAAVLSVRRAGAIHALDTINHFFHLKQMIMPGASYWNMGFGREAGTVQNDEEGLHNMDTLGENVAYLLKKLAL